MADPTPDHTCAVPDPFAPPATDMDTLHAGITDALAELRGARRIYEHSPNAESKRDVELCEWRLDVLLARQRAIQTATV